MGSNLTGEVVAGGQLTINITGKVIKGDGYGKTLGFPTANLDRREYKRKKLKIKQGVWAGQVELRVSARGGSASGGKSRKLKVFRAGIVLGPLDSKRLPKIEAHLVGFKGNLYGKKITITLKKYLRPFKKFRNKTELQQQIKADINKIIKLPW